MKYKIPKLKIFSDKEDYENYIYDSFDNFFKDYKVLKKFFKINNVINIFLNIIISAFLLFYLKVEIKNYILSFICYDIIFCYFEYILLYLFVFCKNFLIRFEHTMFSLKIKNLSLDKILLLKEKALNNKKINQNNQDNLDKINEELCCLNKKIDEYRTEDNVLNNSVARKLDISFVEEVIANFENYNNEKWISKRLASLSIISKEILDIAKDDEDAVLKIVNTYSVYAVELLNIISQYEDMNESQKDNNKEKIKTLMENFNSYLINQKEDIIKFKETKISRDIDFLSKRLSSFNKEEE